MNKFTVIAVSNTTGQILCHHVVAEDGLNAFASAAAIQSGLSMVVAMPGWVKEDEGLTFPGNSVVGGSWILSEPEVFGKPAYEVTSEGIAGVLAEYSLRVSDTKGMSFADMAGDLLNEINIKAVVSAAMCADLSDPNAIQMAGFNALKDELVRLGVLEF